MVVLVVPAMGQVVTPVAATAANNTERHTLLIVVCVLLLALGPPNNFVFQGTTCTKSAPTLVLSTKFSIQIASSIHPVPVLNQSTPYAKSLSNLLKILTIYGLDPPLLSYLCTICL